MVVLSNSHNESSILGTTQAIIATNLLAVSVCFLRHKLAALARAHFLFVFFDVER